MKACVFVLLMVTSISAVASGPELKKVGEARLKVVFWSVFDARLYSPDGSYSRGKRPVRLELQYLLDIESDDLVKKTASEWRSQGLAHQHQQQWLESLSTLWPDVNKRDVITLELDEEDQSTFYINGELLGSLEDKDFGQQFIDIWLSDKTSQPRFRRSLLGQ